MRAVGGEGGKFPPSATKALLGQHFVARQIYNVLLYINRKLASWSNEIRLGNLVGAKLLDLGPRIFGVGPGYLN